MLRKQDRKTQLCVYLCLDMKKIHPNIVFVYLKKAKTPLQEETWSFFFGVLFSLSAPSSEWEEKHVIILLIG